MLFYAILFGFIWYMLNCIWTNFPVINLETEICYSPMTCLMQLDFGLPKNHNVGNEQYPQCHRQKIIQFLKETIVYLMSRYEYFHWCSYHLHVGAELQLIQDFYFPLKTKGASLGDPCCCCHEADRSRGQIWYLRLTTHTSRETTPIPQEYPYLSIKKALVRETHLSQSIICFGIGTSRGCFWWVAWPLPQCFRG